MIPLPFLGLGGDVGTGLRLAGGVGISGLIRLVGGVDYPLYYPIIKQTDYHCT